jgi:V/A-type H+-transporting ATPase subunit C
VLETYACAVARIRVKEAFLIERQELERLNQCISYRDCLQLLANKGWNFSASASYEDILAEDLKKTWKFILELVNQKKLFSVFLCQNDYHNLKASIKSVITDVKTDIFLEDGLVPQKIIFEAAKKNDFSQLPPYMIDSAKEAMQVLLHTGDGQLCDVILDRDTLKAINLFAQSSRCGFIKNYANLLIAFTNMKIAVRACLAKKNKDFLKMALFPCNDIDIDRLIQAATRNVEEIYGYLSFTKYLDAVPALQESLSSFEKWFDGRVTAETDKEKSNPIAIDPVLAYLLSKLRENRAVKVILSAKCHI